MFNSFSFLLPGIDSINVASQRISLQVSPADGKFDIVWKVNGNSEEGETLTLPEDISGDDRIEVTVSSDCGASDQANIFVVREPVPTVVVSTVVSTVEPTMTCATPSASKYMYSTYMVEHM